MWPFAVVGLGLRYLRMSFLDIFGHPLRKPFRVAFDRVEILGLHKDWWENLTALAHSCTKCANIAMLIPGWAVGHDLYKGHDKGGTVLSVPCISHGESSPGTIANCSIWCIRVYHLVAEPHVWTVRANYGSQTWGGPQPPFRNGECPQISRRVFVPS